MNEILSKLDDHVTRLRACVLCPRMHRPAVSGGAIVSKVISIGQAPGNREPIAGRPFAWTAGKTLFGWFQRAAGITEAEFRASIYMAAVCRCFPGRNLAGGDRVPDALEVATCNRWLERELDILQPELVVPIGKLAIAQFIAFDRLTEIIGAKFDLNYRGHRFDVVPLPHPSGASPWHRIEPGKTLLAQALKLIITHPAWLHSTQRALSPESKSIANSTRRSAASSLVSQCLRSAPVRGSQLGCRATVAEQLLASRRIWPKTGNTPARRNQ